jgi:hypothetical protein
MSEIEKLIKFKKEITDDILTNIAGQVEVISQYQRNAVNSAMKEIQDKQLDKLKDIAKTLVDIEKRVVEMERKSCPAWLMWLTLSVALLSMLFSKIQF